MTQKNNDQPAAAPVEIKTYDILISGATYYINCPVTKQEPLIKAANYINEIIRDIRLNAPTLSHENLLVLCCLNLFEQMDQKQDQQKSSIAQEKQMQELLEKIIKDADSILPR